MRRNHSYLFKIPGLVVALTGVIFGAVADMVQPPSTATTNALNATLTIAYDEDIPTNAITVTPSVLTYQTTIRTLCPEGQYVAKCGNNTIGFNWLKSVCLDLEEDDLDPDTCQNSTRNYFSAVSVLKLYEQMRDVFSSETDQSIPYKDENNHIQYASHDDVLNDRQNILGYMCDINTITCAPCPNGAKVEPSTVAVLASSNFVNKWNIRTFADCYMDEFEDSTGSYVYVQNGSTTPEKCYYGESGNSRIFSGTNIVEYVQSMRVIDAAVAVP